MQKWVVVCWALLALVGADECPDGGECEHGHTCCSTPGNGYTCCPLHQAECCGDHMHCCPEGTLCNLGQSSCVNATASVPWVERVPANQPGLSKSFRMIKPYIGEDDDNVCPDKSQCPPEFSCLMALTRFGCCPLAQGISCPDGKHCCPEGHQCSEDNRSCIKKEQVSAVMCDGESECPEGTTCCKTQEGSWGCCPLPKAVCCEDKIHCCPEGSTCDVKHSKCISSSTKKDMPMWAKLPARRRADWENGQEGAVTAEPIFDETEKVPDSSTVKTLPPFGEEEVSVSPTTKTTCNDVPCNETASCKDGSTCCKDTTGEWACCPLPQAVCCEDHIHCCPVHTTCDVTGQKCNGPSGFAPMLEKVAAFTTAAPSTETATTEKQVSEDKEVVEGERKQDKGERKDEEEEGRVPCDSHTSCPDHSTCCFMVSAKKWGCCPLPEAVCCSDGNHCCPTNYTCDVNATTCIKGEVVIPWYTKLPAMTSDEDYGNSVECDAQNKCPEGSTCCQLAGGQWGCCPLEKAVCCPDKEHCCPQGYSCNMASGSCQKVIMLQLQTVPLTPVYVPKPQPQLQDNNVKCDDQYSCQDGETCCRMSATTWGCCPSPNAVCCSDMVHCCPTGYTCGEGGTCNHSRGLFWDNWNMFLADKKRALVV